MWTPAAPRLPTTGGADGVTAHGGISLEGISKLLCGLARVIPRIRGTDSMRDRLAVVTAAENGHHGVPLGFAQGGSIVRTVGHVGALAGNARPESRGRASVSPEARDRADP